MVHAARPIDFYSDVETFSQRLKQLRKSFGMTQTEFAAHLGDKIWGHDINRYERGVKYPTLPRIIIICKKTGVDANWLLCTQNGSTNQSKLTE